MAYEIVRIGKHDGYFHQRKKLIGKKIQVTDSLYHIGRGHVSCGWKWRGSDVVHQFFYVKLKKVPGPASMGKDVNIE